jgi:hypothetical protein
MKGREQTPTKLPEREQNQQRKVDAKQSEEMKRRAKGRDREVNQARCGKTGRKGAGKDPGHYQQSQMKRQFKKPENPKAIQVCKGD